MYNLPHVLYTIGMEKNKETTLFDEKIGERIRKVRKSRGWSQANLAEAAQLSNVTIYKVEGGKCGLYMHTLVRIADALGVSVVYLLFGDFVRGNERLQESLVKASGVLNEEEITALCKIMDVLIDQFAGIKKQG